MLVVPKCAEHYEEQFGELPLSVAASTAHRTLHTGKKASELSDISTVIHHCGDLVPKNDLEELLNVPVQFVHDVSAVNASASRIE